VVAVMAGMLDAEVEAEVAAADDPVVSSTVDVEPAAVEVVAAEVGVELDTSVAMLAVDAEVGFEEGGVVVCSEPSPWVMSHAVPSNSPTAPTSAPTSQPRLVVEPDGALVGVAGPGFGATGS
jgi:hypothetical protein